MARKEEENNSKGAALVLIAFGLFIMLLLVGVSIFMEVTANATYKTNHVDAVINCEAINVIINPASNDITSQFIVENPKCYISYSGNLDSLNKMIKGDKHV